MRGDGGPTNILCPCGRQLTPWDLSRRFTECVKCYLVRMGAIKPSAASDG